MAKSGSYREIQRWVRKEFGFTARTCWIAHAKEMCGLTVPPATNRGVGRSNPCPPKRFGPLKAAFRHFGMLE